MTHSRRVAILAACWLLAACTPAASPTPTATPLPAPPTSTVAPTAAPPAPTETTRPVAPAPAPTRPACTLGGRFEQLVREVGTSVVGECVEEERTNPANGDAEQRTTRGLLVWRKADGIAAFTNGSATYYGCAEGIQRRSSGEPFACGLALASPVPAPAPRFGPVASPTAVPVAVACPNAIPWNQAKGQVGRQATVGGPVARATFASTTRGQPTFVDLGVGFPDPNRFTILIWGNNRRNFPTPPEQLYVGKTVCVTGQVTEFQGIAQIEVTAPAAIRVVQ